MNIYNKRPEKQQDWRNIPSSSICDVNFTYKKVEKPVFPKSHSGSRTFFVPKDIPDDEFL